MELETFTVVSSDDPCDFGVLNGAVEPAGWGHTLAAVVDVTTAVLVVDGLGPLDAAVVVVTAVEVLPVDVEVDVDALLPLLLHAAKTATAKQAQSEWRRIAAS